MMLVRISSYCPTVFVRVMNVAFVAMIWRIAPRDNRVTVMMLIRKQTRTTNWANYESIILVSVIMGDIRFNDIVICGSVCSDYAPRPTQREINKSGTSY